MDMKAAHSYILSDSSSNHKMILNLSRKNGIAAKVLYIQGMKGLLTSKLYGSCFTQFSKSSLCLLILCSTLSEKDNLMLV